jgi:hypothetical protein
MGKQVTNHYVTDTFDSLLSSEITPRIDQITSTLKDDGLVHFKLNDRAYCCFS